MATFKAQVQGLTSITVGTTPTDDELSQFLVDGTKEVVNRIIVIRPNEMSKFTNTSTDSSNSGIVSTGQILSVVRHHDSTSILRPCQMIDPKDRYETNDSSSLKYRSKYNPGFYILNGKIYTVPASAGSNNDAVVTQVTFAVNQGHSSSSIDNFPDEYEYLVVLYASMRTLQANMGATTITDLTVSAVPPDVPTISTVSYSAATETDIASVSDVTVTGITFPTSDVPTYASQSLTTQVSFDTFFESSSTNPFTDSDPGAFSITAVPPDSISDTITAFSLGGEFDDAMAKAKALIDTATVGGDTEPETAQFWLADEDIEMAGATIGVAAQELQRANLGLQDALQTFNTDVQKFQQEGLGKYNAEVQAYQADVNKDVQEYSNKLQRYSTELTTAFQAWGKTESDNLQKFQLDMQDELNDFNEANVNFQAKLQEAVTEAQNTNQVALQNMQKDLAVAQTDAQSDNARRLQDAVQTAQATMNDNSSKIQKFQIEITQYQSEVGTEVQEYTQNLQAY